MKTVRRNIKSLFPQVNLLGLCLNHGIGHGFYTCRDCLLGGLPTSRWGIFNSFRLKLVRLGKGSFGFCLSNGSLNPDARSHTSHQYRGFFYFVFIFGLLHYLLDRLHIYVVDVPLSLTRPFGQSFLFKAWRTRSLLPFLLFTLLWGRRGKERLFYSRGVPHRHIIPEAYKIKRMSKNNKKTLMKTFLGKED